MKSIAPLLCVALIITSLPAHALQARPSDAPDQTPTRTQPAQGKGKASPRTANAPDAYEQQLRARAVEVLGGVGSDARSWKDAAAAARVQSQVADLTCEADADAARAHLVRAWESAGRVEGSGQANLARYRNVSPSTEARH